MAVGVGRLLRGLGLLMRAGSGAKVSSRVLPVGLLAQDVSSKRVLTVMYRMEF